MTDTYLKQFFDMFIEIIVSSYTSPDEVNFIFSQMFSVSLVLLAMLFFARFTMGCKAKRSFLIVSIVFMLLPIPVFLIKNPILSAAMDLIYTVEGIILVKMAFPKLRLPHHLFMISFILCFSNLPYSIVTTIQDAVVSDANAVTITIFSCTALTAIWIVPCIILFVTKPRRQICEIITRTPNSILFICSAMLLCVYFLNILLAPHGFLYKLFMDFADISSYLGWISGYTTNNPEITPEVLAEAQAVADRMVTFMGEFFNAGFILILELLLCILMPIFMVVSASNKHLRQQNELFEKQIEAQAEHYRNLAAANAEVRRFRHDFKNLRFALEKMLSEGKKTEALAVMQEFSEALDSSKRFVMLFDTGNGIADALLTDKLHRAKEKQIELSFEGAIPSSALLPTDLCVLLGNTIDNAIEACEKLPEGMERSIHVECNCSSGFLFLTVRNPIDKPVAIRDNRVQTTKKDDALHGFGITSLHKVAKKYNGAVKLNADGGYFTVNVDLSLPAQALAG